MKHSSDRRLSNTLIVMLTLFCMVVFAFNAQAKTRDKIQLQEESARLLSELNHLLLSTSELNALFSDQSRSNICKYAKRYTQVIDLLDELEINLKDWKQLVKQNRNDKVYRAYVATLQLAMYSIYSQPNVYLGFLKVYTPDVQGIDCAVLEKSPDMPAWDMKSSEWEIKAESYLVRVQESIEKALSLDPFYDDARIIKAQLMVFQKDYDAALQAFMELDAEGVLGEKRSYLNSWMAYIALQQGDTQFAEEKLKRASAFSEPPENSSWASSLVRSKRMANTHWTVFDHHAIEPPDDMDLDQLMVQTQQAIITVRSALSSPLGPIPTNMTDEKFKSLTVNAAYHPMLMLTLESDKTSENLSRYADMVETLYESGVELNKLMEIWDKLANRNPSVSYYYRLQKSSCGLALKQMIENSKPLLYNKKLIALLETRQEEREEEVVNYLSQWQEWSNQVASLGEDIESVRKMANGVLSAELLAFEYQAVFSDPSQAQQTLDELAERFRELRTKELNVFSDSMNVDADAYITGVAIVSGGKIRRFDFSQGFVEKNGSDAGAVQLENESRKNN